MLQVDLQWGEGVAHRRIHLQNRPQLILEVEADLQRLFAQIVEPKRTYSAAATTTIHQALKSPGVAADGKGLGSNINPAFILLYSFNFVIH